MLLLSLLSYADRSVLAILSPTILHDLHLSVTQYSWAITAFQLSYMIGNPLWGAYMDRAGLFRAAIVAVAVWSLASGAHAFLLGFTGLCAARAVLGFGEGATFPAGLKTVTDTLPPAQRSTGLAVAYSGGSLGAAVAPLLVVPLAARFGWRAAFGLSLLVGLAWLALWTGLRRQLRPPAASAPTVDSAGRNVFPRFNRPLIATALVYGLGASPLAYGLYAAPLYVSRVLHVTQGALGHLLWLPPLGWEAGYLVWGRVSDLRLKRGRTAPLPFFVAFAAAGVVLPGIALCAALPHAVALTMTGFVLAMFLSGGFIVFALADGLRRQQAFDTPGQSSAGFLAGFCISSWALATGALMPVLGKLFDKGDYAASLWGIACVPPVGVLLWWGLLRQPAKSSARLQPPRVDSF